MFSPASIVVLPYPFSDASQQKRRPVLVLTEPDGFGDFIGLAVTSRAHHEASVPLGQEDMLNGNLPKPSLIRTDKVFTLNQALVVKSVGKVRDDVFVQALHALCRKIGCDAPRQS